MANDREANAAKILGFIRTEIQDKSAFFDMSTPIEGVKIDSIDIVHVIFKVEEEFGATVDLQQDKKYVTVGDFVDELLKFVPEKGKIS